MNLSLEAELKTQIAGRIGDLTHSRGIFIERAAMSWLNLPLNELELWENRPELVRNYQENTLDSMLIRTASHQGGYDVLIKKFLGLYINIPAYLRKFVAVNIDGKPNRGPSNSFNWRYSLVIASGGNPAYAEATIITTEAIHPPFVRGNLPQANHFQNVDLPFIREPNFLHPYPDVVNEYSDVPGILDEPSKNFTEIAYGDSLRRTLRVAQLEDLEAFSHFLEVATPE